MQLCCKQGPFVSKKKLISAKREKHWQLLGNFEMTFKLLVANCQLPIQCISNELSTKSAKNVYIGQDLDMVSQQTYFNGFLIISTLIPYLKYCKKLYCIATIRFEDIVFTFLSQKVKKVNTKCFVIQEIGFANTK